MKSSETLAAEEQRGIAEQLSEELALFDLLTRPQIKLTKAELAQEADRLHFARHLQSRAPGARLAQETASPRRGEVGH